MKYSCFSKNWENKVGLLLSMVDFLKSLFTKHTHDVVFPVFSFQIHSFLLVYCFNLHIPVLLHCQEEKRIIFLYNDMKVYKLPLVHNRTNVLVCTYLPGISGSVPGHKGNNTVMKL